MDRVAKAGQNLVAGAVRLRLAGGGIYGEIPARPITKPAQAIGHWIVSIGADQNRSHELREAVAAAAEEVQSAAGALKSRGADRLRDALLSDAEALVRKRSKWIDRPSAPWVCAGVLGGVLVGVLVGVALKRR